MSKSTGLVLQGGGARGAFECGAISRLYQEPDFGIHAVAGASIGAINAACLVGGRTPAPAGTRAPADGAAPWAVQELWRRLKVDLMSFVPGLLREFVQTWGNRLCSPRLDYLNVARWISLYDTRPMRELLMELIDLEKLNSSAIRVTLVAVDVASGELKEFRNWGDQNELTVDDIMASASLPPQFPMTGIDGRQYWDGGLFDNTPMESVIDALMGPDERHPTPRPPVLDQAEDGADLLVYLLQLMPSAGEVPRDLSQVEDRLMQIIFSNKSSEDADRVRQINDYVTLVRRLMKSLPSAEAKRLRNDPLYRKLEAHQIIRLVTIAMRPIGASSGAGDFSPPTIDARIAEGYAAADRALGRKTARRHRRNLSDDDSTALEVDRPGLPHELVPRFLPTPFDVFG